MNDLYIVGRPIAVNPLDYGAMDGKDSSDAFIAAIAAARAGGYALSMPPGTFIMSKQLILDGIDVVGCGKSILKFKSLEDGTPAIIVTRSNTQAKQPVIGGFTVQGPGVYSLGVKNAHCDGVRIDGNVQPKLRDLFILNFDNGLIFNNDVGHIYLDNVEISNCYYGLYVLKNTYDYYISDCRINGNTFANIACGDAGISGLFIQASHVGFAPYGIYQEPKVSTNDVIFLMNSEIDCRFEAIGNAAIFSEHPGNPSRTWTGNLVFKEPGFSWSNTYRIPGRSKDYSFIIPNLQHRIDIIQSAFGYNFQPGDVGKYLVRYGVYASDDEIVFVIIDGQATETDVATGGGSTTRCIAGTRPGVAKFTPGILKLTSGGGDSVAPDGAGYFLGWEVDISRELKFSECALEVKINGTSAITCAIYDARNGLSNMPKVYNSWPTNVTGPGLQKLALNNIDYLLRPGRYVIGVAVDNTASQFTGTTNNNQAVLNGAVRADLAVYGTSTPATLTVTESTKAINLRMK